MNGISHSRAKPTCAPACEYVAIPLGSSSEAPVIRPGPKDAEEARLGRPNDRVRAIDRLEFGIVFSRFGHGADDHGSHLAPIRQVNDLWRIAYGVPMAACGSNKGEQSTRWERR